MRYILYVFLGYAGFVLMLVSLENRLVYFPTTVEQNWQAAPIPAIEDVELKSADGTRIHAWWCPCPGADQALLYCHGNAGNLSHRGGAIVKMRDLLGVSVLIFDYPGYGKSEGVPTEKGCYQAADAGYQWLNDEKKIPPQKILLYGASLGGGVITDLASRKQHRALILVKTFSSMPAVARNLYWWLPLPINALISNRFDSLSKISSCHAPVFIGHGTDDRLIPFAHGKALFEAANPPKEFISLEGAGHNDGLPEVFFTKLKHFLHENPSK